MASEPLRALAQAGGVSLGTAQMVVEELSAAGYLYQGVNGKVLARGGELLSRWAEAYSITLAPSLALAQFVAEDLSWWRSAEQSLSAEGIQVGGEAAGSILDPHLRPASLTLYAAELPVRLVARHRLARADGGGNVTVRHRFWRMPDDTGWLVPAPLVYADFVSSGDPRQREHADRLSGLDDRLVELDRS